MVSLGGELESNQRLSFLFFFDAHRADLPILPSPLPSPFTLSFQLSDVLFHPPPAPIAGQIPTVLSALLGESNLNMGVILPFWVPRRRFRPAPRQCPPWGTVRKPLHPRGRPAASPCWPLRWYAHSREGTPSAYLPRSPR